MSQHLGSLMEGEVVVEIARRDDLVVFDRGWWETLMDKEGWKDLGEKFAQLWVCLNVG